MPGNERMIKMTIEFNGKTYTLTTDADFTGRLLEGGYTNYHEDNEEYDFEMSARATDAEGNKYTVYWIFNCDDNERELDSYDYDDIDRVELIEKGLKVLYKEWRELQSELEQDGKYIDCGESSVRSDFSTFAELDEVISFEEMLELERAY